ncbi:MAG: beta-ketoacyl-[acyl-carrier-protein] synthase family protein [Candidatus Omnitrophota bacterium]
MRRVVITGMGVVSPVGTGKEKFWNALINGKDGVQKCKKLDTTPYRTHMAGEVDDFEVEKYIDIKRLKYPTLTTQYALAAVKMALDDAGLEIREDNKIGIILGASMADTKATGDGVMHWFKTSNRYSTTPSKIYENLHANMHALRVAEYFGFKLCATTLPAACAVGNTAIAYAFDLIRSGSGEAVFAGGHDLVNAFVYGGFNKIKSMAPDCCRPFDKNRKGLIVGEGAGVMLLEDMGFALKRKARIYGEVLGYGLTADGYSAAIPHPHGEGLIQATKLALNMAGVHPRDVGYINAHGTATIQNDRIEARAIHAVYGKKVWVSSIKSMMGHCMGAASALEACASALVVERGIIPANINYTHPDPECDIKILANTAIKKNVDIVVSNSLAFGGNNAVIVLAKFRKKRV